MAVAPTYTNIRVMSSSRCWWAQSGWGTRTSGPGPGAVGRLGGLHRRRRPTSTTAPATARGGPGRARALQQYVRDPQVKLQARLFYERVWLHLAHAALAAAGLHAGPHCRCYWPVMTGGRASLHDLLWRETGRTFLLEDEPAGASGARL